MSAKHRILVIEDDSHMASSLTRLLSGHDRTVAVASTAAEARQLLAAGPTSLVVLDIVLPDEDGRILLRHLRESEDTALLPVIVVSASNRLEQECLALGADAFLPKPVAYSILKRQADRHLMRRSQWALAPGVDPVTGLPGRSAALRALRRCDTAPSGSMDTVVALVAPDRLRRINERFGRAFGDQVLRAVVRELSASVEGARFFRWTGAEVLGVFPAVDLEAGMKAIARAAARVSSISLGAPMGEQVRISISAGLSRLARGRIPDGTIAEAERFLYLAARSGPGSVLSRSSRSLSGSLVLLAEDDEVTATVIRHRLEKAGFTVVHHLNGREAYDAAVGRKADLVISDIKMPGMDGFELLRRLRQHPDYVDTPVVLLSTMNREADIVRGLALGANDYVVKPFSPHELLARVERLVGSPNSLGPTK